MELLKKYWWVLALIAIFVIKVQSKGTKKSIAKVVVDEIDSMLTKK